MDKIRGYLEQFAILAICYFTAVFVVKIGELLLNIGTTACMSGFVYGNLMACGFIAALTFVLYFLFALLSKKFAVCSASVVFGLMALTEAGLAVYHAMTGLLMGKELIIRPLWETIHTIKSAISIKMIIGVVVLFCAYVAFSVWISRKKAGKLITITVFMIMLVSIPSFFMMHVNQDRVAVNKIQYLVRECIRQPEMVEGEESHLMQQECDTALVEKYIAMFPDRQVIDNEYPLERNDNIQNVLGPYFRKSKVKPNVVIVVVESLGADLLGINKTGVCFTPFLDSLSKHSLLWVNCMATTPRSFGVIPAVTGSVPHGLKGFQFGNIPNHNSMFTILAADGYSTNAFYAGNFSFDRVYDYLVAQDIDYMSPFYRDYRDDNSKDIDAIYWGYNDDVMFKKSMDVIRKRDKNKPAMDLFVTISQHEDLQISDKERQQKYYDEAEALNAPSNLLGKMAVTLYTDDALRHFVRAYTRYDDNAIFIITGDHSMNLNKDNPLDAYHVPLIIWSPLLERTARFETMVSHNDITPSVLALLRDNFGVKTPETVSWVSDGLDTLPGFHSNVRNYFLHYARELKDFVWDDYYFTMKDKKHPLSRIVEGLQLKTVDDNALADDLKDKFMTMVYVDNYVYSNDKLIKTPVFANDRFKIFKKIAIKDSLYCASRPEKPSESKPKATSIYESKFKERFSEIKIVVTADIKFTGKVYQDKFISIIIDCDGDKMRNVYSSDLISKYIMERYPKADNWYKLEFTKFISVNNSRNVKFKIFMLPPHKDELWNPEHTVTLKNVNINILGLKDN